MTTLSHLDPKFGNVFAIEAANEPINDAAQTPDYGTCMHHSLEVLLCVLSWFLNLHVVQENFVQIIRAVELTLGISVPSSNLSLSVPASVSNNFTAALIETSSATIFSAQVQAALLEAVPIIMGIGVTYGLQTIFEASPFKQSGTPLVAKWVCYMFLLGCIDNGMQSFMDVNWQYNNPSNPADVAIGPQAYDDHLYYSWVYSWLYQSIMIS